MFAISVSPSTIHRVFHRFTFVIFVSWFLLLCRATPSESFAETWDNVLGQAKGQTVYWNAWGGDPQTNAFIDWAIMEVATRYDVDVRHVKLTDTSEAVARVLAEKAAGRTREGSVDVIWINGENFAAMKQHDLLYGPFLQWLPNARFIDLQTKPTTVDFTIPVENMEAPWSMGYFIFLFDHDELAHPPDTMEGLLDWAVSNPGRFTYPQPPDFTGTSFLKHVLLDEVEDASLLYKPVQDSNFQAVTRPLWAYLDRLHPLLWRKGRAFPRNGPALTRMLANGEVSFSMSFNPSSASAGIATGQLPPSIRTFILSSGTIANASFLAIPYNSSAKEGAMVLINFLLSPEAQARKQHPKILGSPTVLSIDKLSNSDQSRFEVLQKETSATLLDSSKPLLSEPHPSWVERLEMEWSLRYASGN